MELRTFVSDVVGKMTKCAFSVKYKAKNKNIEISFENAAKRKKHRNFWKRVEAIWEIFYVENVFFNISFPFDHLLLFSRPVFVQIRLNLVKKSEIYQKQSKIASEVQNRKRSETIDSADFREIQDSNYRFRPLRFMAGTHSTHFTGF